MERIISWLILYFTLYIVISVHEILGHALAAWILGIPIKSIFIGSPTVYSRKIKTVSLSLGLLPIWGGVLPVEEDFFEIVWWKRFLMTAAGPFVSIGIPFVIAFILGGQEGIIVLANIVLNFCNSLFLAFQKKEESGIALLTQDIKNDLAEHNFLTVLFVYTWLISLFIGLVNLLPIPILDGGRMLLTILEGIFGKGIQKLANLLYILSGIALLCYFAYDLLSEVYLLLVK
ncbi:hypothetical protein A2955_02920 [Candidatus Woesebacteria bacterium RIFCSPLOWO2_01_FULL_37_19]|uniref:Peptidase M50 domain-containing protein n=2 Tax=Candidatus Woeseibacteriota TaxID=1752722 RepID=A0A1F8B056_9BACT|nr:MAG: hypothetical protein A2771_04000 [Candidatus Woesebacteria bacterium RIFCSPHIGHO2_01_FULL_38_26b]OGM57392.1 MAG: hypothetical protein A2955_02920 [Candidatus Woesebacteria bacterium RIFCSPLOWO2_01_FULL_37_19]